MSWIKTYQRIWRTALLVLLAIAFVGPWTGDRIHVPAEYACSPPYLRLEGDMCGMIGVFGIVGGALRMAGWLVTGTFVPADLAQGVLFLGSCLLFILPLLTTLLLILGANRLHKFNILAWSLVIIVGLAGLFPPLWMWGIWLYIGLAATALTLELAASMASRRPGRAHMPDW